VLRALLGNVTLPICQQQLQDSIRCIGRAAYSLLTAAELLVHSSFHSFIKLTAITLSAQRPSGFFF